METAQLGQLFLDGHDWRRIINLADQPQRACAEPDHQYAVCMHKQPGDQQVSCVSMAGPERAGHQGHQRAGDNLDDLPPVQQAQPRARLVELAVLAELQAELILLLKAALQGLPGEFEVVEFHDRFHVSGQGRCGCVASGGRSWSPRWFH